MISEVSLFSGVCIREGFLKAQIHDLTYTYDQKNDDRQASDWEDPHTRFSAVSVAPSILAAS